MKSLIFSIALLLPFAVQAEEKNMLAGIYAACVVSHESTSTAPKSNFYVFIFGEDSSLNLIVENYEGTEKCNRQEIGRKEYDHFRVLDDTGNNAERIIAGQDVGTKLFFKFMIAKSYVAINSSTAYPVNSDLGGTVVIDRVQ